VKKVPDSLLPQPWRRLRLRARVFAGMGRVTENYQPAYSVEQMAEWIEAELADAYLSGVLDGARMVP
jgi:hypothetical protein